MNTRYKDLIDQTFDFPQNEFATKDGSLYYHGINLEELAESYGTPLKFVYLPKIGENIERARLWFNKAFEKYNYKGDYIYCYCTKSSHFSYVIEEALKHGIHLETSSAFDINIIENLYQKDLITKEHFILCNGFKNEKYINKIADLINEGFTNTVTIIDNLEELQKITSKVNPPIQIGLRIASEEEPKFPFYTSRLGIGYKDIVKFYKEQIENNANYELKMLHFFINTGITDSAYYWNELTKCLRVYCELKKVCPSLTSLDIGGGFPIKNSLAFEFDYEYMIDEIVNQIKLACEEHNVDTPDIFTEFGSFTVGESAGMIYQVLSQKKQNDREKWNMINSSFITTLPDTWAINKKFIMLPLNRWNDTYERVMLGGITCDSDDYYNSEQHSNAIYLPYYTEDKPLYVGFFNTGAYQESIGGYGGIHHCLIPQPKHIIIDENHDVRIFNQEQTPEEMLSILGY